ncbi:MAG: hypothetical protein [Arizlama microvirus]|nr:MAG: hypothetical protein [Arizlama microvirus]
MTGWLHAYQPVQYGGVEYQNVSVLGQVETTAHLISCYYVPSDNILSLNNLQLRLEKPQ